MNGEVLIKIGIGSIQARYGRGERGEQARWRAVAAVLLECGVPPASAALPLDVIVMTNSATFHSVLNLRHLSIRQEE